MKPKIDNMNRHYLNMARPNVGLDYGVEHLKKRSVIECPRSPKCRLFGLVNTELVQSQLYGMLAGQLDKE
uniref:Uncharacterized protein n=1 Tax=Strigamia maritima TaxID=126957 RepID=T1ILW0_STRMM